MQDYYRLRMKLLHGSASGNAFALKSWIGFSGAILWFSTVVVIGALRNDVSVIAMFIVALLFLLAIVTEEHPRFGSWAIILPCSGGFLFSLWVLFAGIVKFNGQTFSIGQYYVVSAFLVFFFLVFRAAWVHRNAALGRRSHDPRIVFLLLGIVSFLGLIGSIAGAVFLVPLQSAWSWTLSLGGIAGLLAAVASIMFCVRKPLSRKAWTVYLRKKSKLFGALILLLYVATVAGAFVLNVILGLDIEHSLYLAWPIIWSISATLLVLSAFHRIKHAVKKEREAIGSAA